MPNILFLVDTSGSMNQRTFYGTTFLDIAKGAVEYFLKARQKSGSSTDRYMLLTSGEFPRNIKANWKDPPQIFLNELKSLSARGVTLLGDGFKTAFDMLNISRMISRIDNYGQGRNPWFLEPTLIICLTDGHTFSSCKGPENELTIPLSTIRGSELTTEPYRWDQRVFSLVLQIPGVHDPQDESFASSIFLSKSSNTALNDLCEVTGGRAYKITSIKGLNQCVDSLAQRIQHGVVLKFICNSNKHNFRGLESGKAEGSTNGYTNGMDSINTQPTGTTSPRESHKMIYVKTSSKGQSNGQWPIPEPYFPDRNMPELTPRSAHPEVLIVAQEMEPLECEYISPDVYEVEPCPVIPVNHCRKSSSYAWPVYVPKSGRTDDVKGLPFGYLKPSDRKVYLYVYPYNYPQLFPLLNELVKVHKCKPPTEWCKRFDGYLSTMPLYYALPLRLALKKLSVGHLVPEAWDYYQNHNISTYLKNLAQLSKQENDRIIALVVRQERVQQIAPLTIVPNNAPQSGNWSKGATFDQLISNLTSAGNSTETSQNSMTSLSKGVGKSLNGATANSNDNTQLDLDMFSGFSIPNPDPHFRPNCFKNPFDTKRHSLIEQVCRMSNNFHSLAFWGRPYYDLTDKHSIAISAMGNYQEFLSTRVPPLREIDPTPPRQHAFGNPYKLAGADREKMMIDETEDYDEHQVSSSLTNQSSGSSVSNKRAASPMIYKPGKRIRAPSTPPPPINSSGYSSVGNSKMMKNLKMRVRERRKSKNGSSSSSENQDRSAGVSGSALSPVQEFVGAEVLLRKGQETRGDAVGVTASENLKVPPKFDEEKWKKRTDELVHAVCRLIRYPNPQVGESIEALCNKLDGPTSHQCSVIKFLLSEADKFKRYAVAARLKNRLESFTHPVAPESG